MASLELCEVKVGLILDLDKGFMGLNPAGLMAGVPPSQSWAILGSLEPLRDIQVKRIGALLEGLIEIYHLTPILAL